MELSYIIVTPIKTTEAMAFKNLIPPVKRCKNKFRHDWIDDGKSQGIELYKYTCPRCGQKRIKNDSFSMSYYDKDLNFIGTRAPECVRSTH